MSDIVKRLRDRRMSVWEDAKGLADRAADENRAFTAEEQGQWDALNEELDTLDKRIKSAMDTEQRGKDADQAFDRLVGKKTEQRTEDDVVYGENTEIRKWLKGQSGSRYYEVRPHGYVSTDIRTLSKLAAGSGASATVPTSFYDRLMAHLIEVSGILQAGPTVLRTDSGEQIQVPKTTAHSSAVLTAEAASLSASDPVFSQAALSAYKYGHLLQISRELIDDTGVDLEGYLAMQAGRALGNAFGAAMVTGTGSGTPTGVLNNSTLGVQGPTGGTGGFGAQSGAGAGGDLLIDLFYSVIAPYRASSSCAWLVKDSTMGAIRKLKDSTGNYVFQPALVAGTPDMLVSKPIYTDPFVPAIASGAKSVIFGDWSQFFVRFAGGVRFERSDEYAFANDLVTFRAVLRGDSILVDQTGAIKHFVN